MHVLIITFELKDISDAEYRLRYSEFAPEIAALPGLIAKVWLANPATNIYGGVYTWEDQAACEAYTRSDLFRQGVLSNPDFAAVEVRDFSIVEEPTRVTHGLAGVGV